MVFDEEQYKNLIDEQIDTEQYMPRNIDYNTKRERSIVPETIGELLKLPTPR